ncbi:stimulator of interferon genes protein homolog [Onthophagus taurus]|uniref:stimulator of interferon genes protein homolog n=1 Tax=Onthophagus taurus TaxID=166361 RepID=UPI000C20A348|nr:stimulator of interferon genes protein [Onthophagus taurus]
MGKRDKLGSFIHINPKKRGITFEVVMFILAAISFLIGCHFLKSDTLFEYICVSLSFNFLLFTSVIFAEKISLFIEEMKHLDSRYKNNWLLLIKFIFPIYSDMIIITIMLVTIIILSTTPYGSNIIKIMENFGFSSNLFALFSSLILQKIVPLGSASIHRAKMMEKLGGLDSGVFMAYSYYHGFLKIVLPNTGTQQKGFKEFQADFESKHGIQFAYNKLIILVPMSLFCPPNLVDHSKYISLAQSLGTIEVSRGGVHNRVYKNTVYKLEKDGNRYYVCAEYATPLRTMYDIVHTNNPHAVLYETFQNEFIINFYQTLKDILENSEETRDLCDLVLFNDQKDKKMVDIGNVIINHIKKNN